MLALLLNVDKIFSVFSYRRWDEKCRFSGLLDWFYSGFSYTVTIYEKQSVANSGVASNWTLATRTQQTTPFSKMVSTPVFIFVHQTFIMRMADK